MSSLRHRSPSLIKAAAAERQSSPALSKEINEELKVCEFSDDVLDIVEVRTPALILYFSNPYLSDTGPLVHDSALLAHHEHIASTCLQCEKLHRGETVPQHQLVRSLIAAAVAWARFQDESNNFNNVNAATALLRVARISGNVPQAARQDLLRDSRFLKLMGLVQFHASSMRPRELCSILQSMVYLRCSLPPFANTHNIATLWCPHQC